MDELDYEVLYLVTKTIPAACECCKDAVTLEAGSLVELVVLNRDGTVEVNILNTCVYVDCPREVLIPWPLPKGD